MNQRPEEREAAEVWTIYVCGRCGSIATGNWLCDCAGSEDPLPPSVFRQPVRVIAAASAEQRIEELQAALRQLLDAWLKGEHTYEIDAAVERARATLRSTEEQGPTSKFVPRTSKDLEQGAEGA